MQDFAKLCASILELQYPVDFLLDVVDDEIDGFHLGYSDDNLFHLIRVSPEASRGIREVIAHEFCHAYLHEQHQGAKWHGRTFVLCCRRLRRELAQLGVKVGPLYLKGVDV